MTKVDSHLYRNVHDENPYTITCIVIRTNMYMTKTQSSQCYAVSIIVLPVSISALVFRLWSIWFMFIKAGYLDISSEWKCIVSVPHLIKHVNRSWCHIDLCHFEWNFIILRVEINSIVCFVMYKIVLWMSILTYDFVWVFVMYMFVRMGFRHAHFCTNDYTY